MTKHVPVLLDSVMKTLGDIKNLQILDATFGAGGYTRAFLNAGARVVAFDRDPNVIDDAKQVKQEFGDRFEFVHKPFSDIATIDNTFFDAIVFDLGISSMQIDNPERGFSFRADAPLDMRMSMTGPTVIDMFENLSVNELAGVLRDWGDVGPALAIANAIKKEQPKTTFELKKLIHNPKDVAPVFQALRIAVNNEMGELTCALKSVPDLLNVGGCCICVTFHSIEDRIVKNVFREWTTTPGDPHLPETVSAKFLSLPVQVPSEEELMVNPRARSAHMRGVKKSY